MREAKITVDEKDQLMIGSLISVYEEGKLCYSASASAPRGIQTRECIKELLIE